MMKSSVLRIVLVEFLPEHVGLDLDCVDGVTLDPKRYTDKSVKAGFHPVLLQNLGFIVPCALQAPAR